MDLELHGVFVSRNAKVWIVKTCTPSTLVGVQPCSAVDHPGRSLGTRGWVGDRR
eukprot:CAMPEP_0195037072 /NCGR_PEP_ID=MMETSP0326_2-20130528/74082_1 /TAXON_ID=2866 ORGANISM="Crypthecodinium cohnii, Strain Seligo" /NCGR_SAMPLE_ID=MMETSP0326_2 /ASSEMBLY_ACC=CAM_ASM_000348 /LENGTH=53 /DNA_ID=CAMNT_0040062911 /DNA_START=389 /DNA_END=547 /DNA_ORIENTATION=+